MVLEKQEEIKELKSNSIPKDKIREKLKKAESNFNEIRQKARERGYGFKEDYEIIGKIETYKELLEEE